MFERKIAVIVAASINECIGKDNKLCWNIPNDLKRFKTLTINNVVIMGRKTFESIGKPLPNRINIIITRNKEYIVPEGCIVSNNIDEAINLFSDKDVFIIGGEEIYNQSIGYANSIFLTRVSTIVDGDAFFRNSLLSNFSVVDYENNSENGYDFTYYTYQKCQ